ncbi:unnamed protein product [Echinostoma caproni]|uniref:DUF1618 domain-containing protein n=1 Tax=Echinostoma caproni TaxID=27848 RepID=A0A183B1T4_9TREM|nr:unnamed protein product [Echinostoma caproni]
MWLLRWWLDSDALDTHTPVAEIYDISPLLGPPKPTRHNLVHFVLPSDPVPDAISAVLRQPYFVVLQLSVRSVPPAIAQHGTVYHELTNPPIMPPKGVLLHEINGCIQSYRSSLLVPRMLDLDVDYGVGFDFASLGPLRDMCLDPVESRYGTVVLNVQMSYAFGDHKQVLKQRAIKLKGPPGLGNDSMGNCHLAINQSSTRACADTVQLAESVSWIALSDCSRTHNLIGASLGPNGTGRAVLVDPLIGAVAITLAGGHSESGLSQVCWCPRTAHTLITSGYVSWRFVFLQFRPVDSKALKGTHGTN